MATGIDPARLAADETLVALGNTEVPRRYWEPDATGIFDGGQMGGDGSGESVSVRFTNRFLPCARITASYHVVDVRERGGSDADPAPFMVEEMCEFLLAKNPIAEADDLHEVWSDYTHTYVNGARFATEESAQAMRDRCAASEAKRETGERFYWSGRADGQGVGA
jgi:hypothetical protein